MDNRPDIDAATHPLSKIVLQYSDIHDELVKRAKEPGFTIADWAPLAELVDVETFQRVGTFREQIDWAQYTQMLTEFAGAASWEGTFKAISEFPDRVFLELEERISRPDGECDVINSVSVFRFNAARKITRLDIYMQSPRYAVRKEEADTGFRPLPQKA